MEVYFYETLGGKNLITEFLNSLPKKEMVEGYRILEYLEISGIEVLKFLNTRHIIGKIYEIKFYRYNRIFYVAFNEDRIFLLHACNKQKNKAENKDVAKAVSRLKELRRDNNAF